MSKQHIIRKSWELIVELLRCTAQIVRGYWKISTLKQPAVTIFGASLMQKDASYSKEAYQLAYHLAQEGFSVLSGGGPGIMEAATCGAAAAMRKKSQSPSAVKIVIRNLAHNQTENPCPGMTLVVDYFFVRKWLLIDYSIAFIVFPGGFGTLDELSDLLNLIQTGKIHSRVIILIGTQFWQPYLDLIANSRKLGLIDADHHEPHLFVTDDVDTALTRVRHYCKSCGLFPNLTP